METPIYKFRREEIRKYYFIIYTLRNILELLITETAGKCTIILMEIEMKNHVLDSQMRIRKEAHRMISLELINSLTRVMKNYLPARLMLIIWSLSSGRLSKDTQKIANRFVSRWRTPLQYKRCFSFATRKINTALSHTVQNNISL